MNAEDMCIDYKLKFGIKFDKLLKGDYQLGIFLDKRLFGTYLGDRSEFYIYLCIFKYSISIGWFLKEQKEDVED